MRITRKILIVIPELLHVFLQESGTYVYIVYSVVSLYIICTAKYLSHMVCGLGVFFRSKDVKIFKLATLNFPL